MKTEKMTIKEIEDLLNTTSLSRELLSQLKTDRRIGVVRLAERYEKRLKLREERERHWQEMNRLERRHRKEGYRYIAGVDEVGRGPLAGPVVAGAVILDETFYLPGIDDSKKLSPDIREAYYREIMDKAVATGIGIVDVAVIDEKNIYQATLLAMQEAVRKLSVRPDFLINDAVTLPQTDIAQLAVKGGDGKSASVAAASIIAKVTRDRLMQEYARRYPQYAFHKNMGYGTKEHLEALKKYGPCDIHRRSFGLVKEYAG